jgi:CDP-diacylglycerol--glycerol-3-phosphate 3-phosphatidyltransferase
MLDDKNALRRIITMNLALLLTCIRLSAIPVFGVVYFLPFHYAHPVAAIIFVIAAITDWLDGYFARKLSQTTDFGAFLDPVADKLLVGVAIILVVGEHYIAYLSIPAAIIICREILISALREWMAEIGKRTSMAVTYVSKVKTAIQMVAVILLVWYIPSQHVAVLYCGVALLWLAALLTVWTMIVYLKVSWPDLTMSGER